MMIIFLLQKQHEYFFMELTSEDAAEFSNFCRMSPSDFKFLLHKITFMIEKQQTRLRMPIPAKIRLAITLRYLATGDSYKSLHYLFKVSTPAISLIIPEVCKAINSVLKDQIKLPQTPAEWLIIEEGFRRKFPRCVGAIDGKHIVIKCPPHSGSQYYNYKHTYSIVLMALVDSEYRFIFADIGAQGRISDGGIFQNCLLWQKIDAGTINLPPDAPLPGREIDVPYVFLGDGAFALHKHIMKPFPGNYNFNTMERTFNHKLSSSRVIVENVFGILTTVFRIFRKPIEIDIENVPTVTMTCILLHNFLKNSKTSSNIYAPPGTFDSVVDGVNIDGSWRQNQTNPDNLAIRPIADVPRRSSRNVCEIRTEFAHYFHNLNTENN
ncbi:protein ANTAGONIST OF LIKE HETEROCHROMATIN PROTEIN 1-like [Helicoverpa zea]|uniref:protein ANTAGONIST OF LIKE HETEROCHROMATIN PROTEIN 1-like n=1 Tax=Helicoverpa zea TaxID=7113 RepID=UPI001F57B520|nr:protein ANTAGONIST OF LIKE HETEROCHROMATIN PROTEIN 1-like [Helicoverpa zea]